MSSATVCRAVGLEAKPHRPKVLILIATDPIGGPGKGLFQFLKFFPTACGDYILSNFDVKGRPAGQFIDEARRRRLPLMLLNQRVPMDPTLVLQARRLAVRQGVNLIQTHGYKTHVIGFFLRKIWRMPWIGFSHGFTDDNWKVRLYNRIDLAVLRHADVVVTVSESMRTLLVRKGIPAHKIRLVYNAIEAGDGSPRARPSDVRRLHNIGPGRTVVGVIGRLNPEKGQIVFLEALKAAIVECPEIVAIMVGDGQDRGLLEQYCRDHGLTEHVIFAGYKEDISDYYDILDLLVLPSLSEGLPNTVLEAMACGVPVLATRVGGVPEIIRGDNGVLVPPSDPVALAARMVELLQNDEHRKAMAERARASLYPKFDPVQRARQILDLYNEVLSGRHTTNSEIRHG